MHLQHIQPHPQLKGYIDKMWAFESNGRAPHEDMKLIVPNGKAKLTIPYRNGVSGNNKDGFRLVKESSIILIGMCDVPTVVDLENDAPHGNIGIEFSPLGAYRLFQLRHAELKNKIFLIEEVLGKSGKEIQAIIADTESVNGKIQIIQTYLIKLLLRSESDQVLDYCIHQIESSKGLATVADLAFRTGYSSRWIYEKFMEKVGLSPKNLSSVVRFSQFYEQWAKHPGSDFFNKDLRNYFYDQSHFIKDFKRFTGFSPLKFAASENEFGRIFYKD
jgi:AraC-like DNA-binding protein